MPEVDPSKADANDTPGNEEQTTWKPPSDGSYLPKERVDLMVGVERDKNRALESELQKEREQRIRLEERSKAPTNEQTKIKYSREQLSSWVDSGQITQSDMDTQLHNQTKDELREEMRSEWDQRQAEMEATKRMTGVREERLRYRELFPDIDTPGSEERAKLQSAWDYFTSVGDPQDDVTENKALRMAFGSLDRLREKTRETRETHVETGGAGSVTDGGSGEGVKLDARKTAYVNDMIRIGQYKDWNDPALKADIKVWQGQQ